MSVRITINSILSASVPTEGWIVKYRVKGTLGAYITAVGSPFMAQPIIIDTTDAAGTLYEGKIKCDCGSLESDELSWETPCDCEGGFVVGPSGSICQSEEFTTPTVTNSGYCLSASVNGAYNVLESRIYTNGFTTPDLNLPAGSIGGNIFARMTATPQWANPLFNSLIGPLNREGVWIDSDCDDTTDGLSMGVQTTVSFLYNNLGATRTVYLGISADNQFQVKLNGALIADSGNVGAYQFQIWHIIPVTIVPGVNYFNGIGTGDGSVNDSLGMVLYDNTAAQIAAALADADLTILFKTSSLRGTSFDVATCPDTYSLDTSGGSGDYTCVKTITAICNAAP